MKYHIPNMSCSHCTATIEKALTSLDPKAKVETDLAERTVTVYSGQDIGAIKATLEKAGYPATPS